ncbi:Potassium-transporting ATPase A subunit [Loktanella fryxellensis]|uniref:Potassium-transporting ATPase A subunit n=1 Tax=Loktanella fryxellensis TaxID=245187 RepID=A0A1H8JAC0_9RHOB|nr:potassium-transporting ATPase subunit KdpA [Loktanella fryxellensis]SEN77720.1 Potassium-transporting ATPase A subunit [Loktanella fryxellensis]
MDHLLIAALIVGGTALLSWPLGAWMTRAMDPIPGQRTRATAFFARVGGTSERQSWRAYLVTLLTFNIVMFTVTFATLALQQYLPLNPDGMGPHDPTLVSNTAASFTTNTNLQHYSGEASMSYLSQLGGLMWLQFVSAAIGIAVLAALTGGLAWWADMGNFLIDVQCAAVLILLSLAALSAVLLVLRGVPMTLQGSATATTLEGAVQAIARWPVADFVAIEQLGTNGGGVFGPNSTLPLENQTFWTDGLSMVAIILIPMACVWMFDRILDRKKHASLGFAVMAVFLLVKITAAVALESAHTVAFADLAVATEVGNLEGKELRFGVTGGPLWAVPTTATSTGRWGPCTTASTR